MGEGAVAEAGTYLRWRIGDVTVTRVPVTVGLSSDTETQVVSGLTEGEAIVVRTTSGTTAVTTGATGAARGNATFGGGGAVRAVPAGGATFRAGG